MLIPVFMLLSFGLLVALIGLYVLAYSKKEGLGKIYKWTSYLTVTCGTIVCIGAIVAGCMFSCCHKSRCGKRFYQRCHTEMRAHCGDHSYGHSCESKNHCSGKKECKNTCEKKIEKEVIIDTVAE